MWFVNSHCRCTRFGSQNHCLNIHVADVDLHYTDFDMHFIWTSDFVVRLDVDEFDFHYADLTCTSDCTSCGHLNRFGR